MKWNELCNMYCIPIKCLCIYNYYVTKLYQQHGNEMCKFFDDCINSLMDGHDTSFEREKWWRWHKIRAPFCVQSKTRRENFILCAKQIYSHNNWLGIAWPKCKVAGALKCLSKREQRQHMKQKREKIVHVCEKWWHTDWKLCMRTDRSATPHITENICYTVLSRCC